MLLRTIYAAGLRLSEAPYLRPQQIDSQQMLLRVLGKGQKERLVPLSPVLLEDLRRYWQETRPGEWLFPRKQGVKPPHPCTVQIACRKAAQAAGLQGKISPHTLRHCYATHLLQAGTDVRIIQALLGHSRVTTTAGYTHMTVAGLQQVVSPLDRLPQAKPKRPFTAEPSRA
jgi:integrase/recombinase XerD